MELNCSMQQGECFIFVQIGFGHKGLFFVVLFVHFRGLRFPLAAQRLQLGEMGLGEAQGSEEVEKATPKGWFPGTRKQNRTQGKKQPVRNSLGQCLPNGVWAQ